MIFEDPNKPANYWMAVQGLWAELYHYSLAADRLGVWSVSDPDQPQSMCSIAGVIKLCQGMIGILDESDEAVYLVRETTSAQGSLAINGRIDLQATVASPRSISINSEGKIAIASIAHLVVGKIDCDRKHFHAFAEIGPPSDAIWDIHWHGGQLDAVDSTCRRWRLTARSKWELASECDPAVEGDRRVAVRLSHGIQAGTLCEYKNGVMCLESAGQHILFSLPTPVNVEGVICQGSEALLLGVYPGSYHASAFRCQLSGQGAFRELPLNWGVRTLGPMQNFRSFSRL